MTNTSIVRIAARGEGVTADGQHVAGAVPGDQLADDGSIVAGPNHAVPPCRHFGTCGGCQLQHVADAELARFVADRVAGALTGQQVDVGDVRPAILSPAFARRRAAMSATLMGRRLLIGFNEATSNRIADMIECHLLTPELTALVAPLRALLLAIAPQRRTVKIKLQQLDQGIELVLEGVAADGLKAAMALQDFATDHRLARLVIDTGNGPETIWEPEPATISFAGIAVVPPPHAFLQPTQHGETALIAAVAQAIGDAPTLADLFAGVGTFALSLRQGRRVYAAEASRDALGALTAAAGRAQAAIVTEHRDLFRRPLTPAELDRFAAVVIDPPRAGAEEQVCHLAASTVPRIAYVSCNPATFARDAKVLTASGYRLDWVQPVGQFRWSTHVELAGCFTRQ